jgi:hypothetical protein
MDSSVDADIPADTNNISLSLNSTAAVAVAWLVACK